MSRIGVALLALMIGSCATTGGPGAGAWAPPANQAGANDDGRIALCVASAKVSGSVYGAEAFQSGIRDAFLEAELPVERRVPGEDQWVPSGSVPNPFRLAACDSSGVRTLEFELGLTSPLFERPVATPWGETYQPSGVGCRMTLKSADAGMDSVRSDRFSVYYRGWSAQDGHLTAEMGRRFGEVLLGRLGAQIQPLPPGTRIQPPEVWQAASW